MPKMSGNLPQNVVVHVGQCGNQVGWRFWDNVVRECRSNDPTSSVCTDVWASYFRNGSLPARSMQCDAADVADSDLFCSAPRGSRTKHARARAVLIDMEESVVNQLLRSDLGRIFDRRQILTDVSGSGNNWAVGYHEYGTQYADSITELLRKEAEACDCLGSFMVLNSLGGGTGSGLGSRVVELLKEHYPKTVRIVPCVIPSAVDDVVTSPYNGVFAMQTLTHHADFVLPIENTALTRMVRSVENHNFQLGHLSVTKSSLSRPYGLMNGIVANTLVNLTASSRFVGSSSQTNCVPFSKLLVNTFSNGAPLSPPALTNNMPRTPKMPFLVTGIVPIPGQRDSRYAEHSPKLDQFVVQALSKPNQLLDVDTRRAATVACCFSLRSKVWSTDDLQRCSTKMKRLIRFCHPSSLNSPTKHDLNAASVVALSPATSSSSSTASSDDGCITVDQMTPNRTAAYADSQCNWNLCRQLPLNKASSVTVLSLSSAFASVPARMRQSFQQLYRRRAYAHHYTTHGVELQDFDEALQCANDLIADYSAINSSVENDADELISRAMPLKSTEKPTHCLSKNVRAATARPVAARLTSTLSSTPQIERRHYDKYYAAVSANRTAALKSSSMTNVTLLKR